MSKPGQRSHRKSPTAERRPRHSSTGSDYLERYPDDDYGSSSPRRASPETDYSREPGRGHQEYFDERARFARRAPGSQR